jgi:hypothetical protein
MDPITFNKMRGSPAVFTEQLVIPAARGPAPFGKVMADFQRKDFEALDPALIALAAGKKPECGRYWWERTKGGSKDSDAAVCLLWLLAFSPRPLVCQVGAADQEQAGELRKAAQAILRLNTWLASAVEIQVWSLVNKATGSQCSIVAADVAGSHGARPDVLVLNELSHVTKREFAENLADNAAKVPNGLVLVCTNAGFVPSWQFDWRENARTSPRWTFSALTEPAPWLDPAEIAEAEKRNSGNRFARLWSGAWLPPTGEALSPDDLQAAITLESATLKREDGYCYYAGLDIGVKRDHTSLVLSGLHYQTRRLKVCQVKDWSPGLFRKVNLAEVQDEVAAICLSFGALLYIDPSQAELLGQTLTAKGVQLELVPFIGKTLNEMASNLIEVFTDRTIDLFPNKALQDDLRRLQLKETPSGWRLVPARTAQGHGDRATALSLSILAAKRAGPIYAGPIDVTEPHRRNLSPLHPLNMPRGIFASDLAASDWDEGDPPQPDCPATWRRPRWD